MFLPTSGYLDVCICKRRVLQMTGYDMLNKHGTQQTRMQQDDQSTSLNMERNKWFAKYILF